jgi:hypothetical protein
VRSWRRSWPSSRGRTTALVDGGGGLPHVPGDVAMRLAVRKARAHVRRAVAVRRSGHFGAAHVTAMAAEAGLIGIATSTTQDPAVVPTFGAAAMLGTNPISLAAPAARNLPFMLDMATSTASLGKLVTAWRKGRAIPDGWALDPSGAAVTSGRRAAGYRRLTPLGATPEMGSHKGYGLATAVAILSAVLSGSDGGPGHFFLVLDPARFRPDGTLGAGLDALLDGLRASPSTPAARHGGGRLTRGVPRAPAIGVPRAEPARGPTHRRARVARAVHPGRGCRHARQARQRGDRAQLPGQACIVPAASRSTPSRTARSAPSSTARAVPFYATGFGRGVDPRHRRTASTDCRCSIGVVGLPEPSSPRRRRRSASVRHERDDRRRPRLHDVAPCWRTSRTAT